MRAPCASRPWKISGGPQSQRTSASSVHTSTPRLGVGWPKTGQTRPLLSKNCPLMINPSSSSRARASGGVPQAMTWVISAWAKRRRTAMCWQPPPEISPPQPWTLAPRNGPYSPACSQPAASCTSPMARCRLPPAKTTPRASHSSIISSTSDRRASMGLSVETPLTPAWAAAMTASLMYLPGSTTTAMSGTMCRKRSCAS